MKLKKTNNKAQLSTLQTLIILLLCTVVAMIFGKMIYDMLVSSSSIEKCRLSVIAASKTEAFGKKFMSLDCPRETLIIKEADVKKGNFIDENKIDKLLAEEYRKCWYKMGEGKLNAFQKTFLSDGNTACLICTEIEFESKLSSRKSTITTLKDYLTSTDIKNTNMKYSSYIYNDYSASLLDAKTGQFYFYMDNNNNWNETISTYHKKYVVFFIGSDSYAITLGFIDFNKENKNAAVVMIDESAMNNKLKCDYLRN